VTGRAAAHLISLSCCATSVRRGMSLREDLSAVAAWDTAPDPAAGGAVTLEAHDLRKEYGALTALASFSFAARAGEIVGVLGPNGAGKTTALRVLTTILTPTAGSFSVMGVPHTKPGEIRARIGMLPESAGYPAQQTAAEFLSYHGRLYGRDARDARATAAALLEEVALSERASSLIASFSRGMRQRLGIARALVNDPAVVFLDEPTLGLDPAGRRQVLRMVADIARDRGATVLLSTHVLGDVEEICDRAVILARGRVVAEGTVAEIVRRAAAPRRLQLRVAAPERIRAAAVLTALPGVATAVPGEAGDEWLSVVLQRPADGRLERPVADVVDALARAGIAPLGFELEGARLSDAFLALTREA
jgi:ABC-2 type transport system ATP-binding protein